MDLNRNAESRFAVNPTYLDISRSRFDRTSTVKTSFNVGDLVPFYIDEVLPGDTFDVSTAKVVRMQPMVAPPMDDLFLDTYYFFVPNRLVWEHWPNLMGENDTTSWYPTVDYSVPQVISPHTGGWQIGTIADYFGVPTGVPDLYVSALPFRAYAKIVNDWFRDENLVDPAVLTTGDATTQGSNGSGLSDYEKGGKPFVAAKLHDYFSSSLPSPQKGEPVTVPVSNVSVPIDIPVTTSSTVNTPSNNDIGMIMQNGAMVSNENGYFSYTGAQGMRFTTEIDVDPLKKIADDVMVPVNLRAVGNAIGSGFATSINELRMAFQMQKLLERDARGGTRYIEMIKSHFGVTSPMLAFSVLNTLAVTV